MPKPTGKKKYSGSGYGEKDFQRELVQADKRQLQEERARRKDTAGKTQRMNELNKQYREINSYVGPELPGDRAARERGYYANLAQYGSDYGDQAAYDSGYQRYKAAMQSIETAGAQTARTAAGTARMSQAGDMIQDVLRRGKRPFEVLGGKRAADFAAEDLAMQGSRLDRDHRTYTQMARGAQMAGDREMLRSARQGLADSSGRYADAMAAYGEKSRGARDSYLRELEQTNKGAYYGETHGAQEIEGRLRDLRRKREQLDSMDVTWTDGMGGPAESKQDYVSARGQELDAEIAQWEAALRHRNAIDKADEMRRVAESITNAPNFRELSEVGRAMVEGRNKQAKDSAIYPEEPEDPDNWRNYQRYLQKEKEALAQAGYVADLDSSYIPEDVKPVYYALFAQNPQKAREWAEYWQGVGEDEYWRQIYEASGEDAGSRLGAFIQGTFANTVAGLNPFGEGGQYAAKLGSTMIGGGAAGLTEKGLFNTGALAGEIDVPIFGKQTLGNAYQLGSSMLQSAANATLAKMTGGAAEIVGGMGTILLGSSAAAQDYQQKLEQGWDETSAKWHALAAGAAEAGFEYLSLDKLVNQDISRGFIRNVLLQGGIEASEEVNTTIANRLTDAAISALSGYDNSIQQRAKELMAFGYEAGTADKMAQQEWLTELLNDALGGFLSGGLMTGGQYAMLPVYRAIGAVDDFNRFTGALSDTGETAITETAELTRGKAGALAGQIGASLNAETVEAARRIMGETAQNNVDGGQIARAAEQNDGGDVAVNERRYDGQNDNVERGTGNPSPTEQKQSRRELRRQAREQRKQSTRDGAVYEQAVQKVQQAIDQRGVGAVNEVYAETVEQYGEAAKGIAQEAITRAVSRQLSEARNVADIDRMTQAENAAPEVRAAIQQAKDLRSYQLFAQNGDAEAAERAIQSRRNSGRGSGALKLEAEYSGEDGSIKRAEIIGVTANAESVKLSNGETVSAKQLANLDADTRDVLDRIAYMEVGPAADILWKSYLAEAGSGTDGYRYVMDWATAYDQGRQGSVSLKEAQGRSSLSAETVKNAYELGEQYGKDLDAKQKAELAEKMKITKKGATGRAGTVNTEQIGGMKLSEDQSKQLQIVKRLAEAFGIDVEVFASGTKDVTVNGETRRQFVGENGRYQDGKIWLDINAGLNYTDDVGSGLVATMGHELTHFIQEYAPEEYRAYKRFVLATIRQQEGSQGLERLIREKIQRSKGQNLSRSAAEDEVVADAAQTVLTDSQALRQMAEQEPTLFQKVLDWIKDFFDSIREALSGSPRMSEEARLIRALEADVRKTFGELWDKGITEAVRVHDEVGDIDGNADQYSLRDVDPVEPSSDAWSRSATFAEVKAKHPTLFALDADESDTRNPTQVKVTVSTYRKIYNMLKAEGFNGTILDASSGLGLGTETGRKEFGFDVDDIEPFPDKSYKPMYTDYSTLDKTYDVVISNAVLNVIPQDLRDAMVVKIGEMLKPGGRAFINVRGDDVLNAGSKVAINEDGMEYFISNTGSYQKGFTRNELKAYLEDALGDGFTVKIRKDFGKVSAEVIRDGSKAQHSDRDTEYLELAKDPEKNQARLQEIVDEAAREAGYTVKAYHGTTEDFTEFSRGKQGQNHNGYLEFGAGFYFTPSEKEARSWAERGKNGPARAKDSKVMAVYLNPGRVVEADAPIPGGTEYLQSLGLTKADAAFVANRTYRFINYLLEDKGYSNLEVQETLKALGYDAIESTYRNRTEGQYVVFDPEQIKSADPVTYDDKHKPIPLSERFNDAKRDIRFQMREPVEQTDRLIALHNLNATKLGKALDLGGFPMPSIAVTKTNIPHTNFGEITLVMDKSTIDPQRDRRNTVYSADAWTPTFPGVEYEVDEKAASQLRKKYFEIAEKYGKEAADPLYPWANYAEDELNRKGGPEEILDRYRKDTDMMKLYLMDNGLTVPEAVREEKIERMDEATVKFYDTFVQEMGKDVFEELMVRKGETALDYKKRWFNEHGEAFEAAYRKYMQEMGFSDEEIRNVLDNETISSLTRQAVNIRNYLRNGAEKKTVETNVTATNDAIRAAVDGKKYDAWLHALFDGIVKSSGIYNGKDRYTPSGNERSFASTHYAVTLENIAKAMAAQNDGNSRNVDGFYGVKSLRAGMAKRFSSIAEMHQTEGRLQHLTEEQAQAITDALQDRLGDVTARIYNTVNHDKYDNYFIATDHIGNNLMEITEQKNITADSIKATLSKYRYNIDNALAEDIRALLFDVSQMPVNIYEAKPERAVRFNEVLAAVVPSGTDGALVNRLHDAGVQNVIEYAAGDDADRLAKVNSVEGAQFSERDYDLPSDLELMDRAAESLSEAGGEEYWAALLETAPELADDKAELKSMAKAYREQSRKLTEAERKLAEARQQLVTTDRKLRTRGISGVTTSILKDLHAGDVKNRNVQQTVTDILTKAYQKGLDAIDAGKSQSEVWDVVYNEGIVKAADYILENATYSEKTSRKWTTVILNKYMTGEEGRYAVLDAISARVVPDWWESRARQPLQQTAADRIVSRVEGRMQKQIDAQTQRAESAEASNRKLREDLDFWRTAQDNAAKQVTFLGKRLEEARADMKDVKQADAKERRQKTARIRSLENQLKAKREEAWAWKQMASRNEQLLRAALKSKNADLEAQAQRADKAEAALAGQTVNAKAWERNADLYAKQLDKQLEQKAKIVKQLEAQVQREKDILSGKLKPIAMQRLLAAAREEAASKAKEKKEEVFQNYKERKNQTAIRNRIKNLHAEMQRDLLKPREGHFVPETLIRPVVELLDMVNIQTNRAKSESAQAKIDAINAQYDKLKNDERYSAYYDETVKALLVKLSSTLNGRSIYDLNSDELADVYTAMKAMRTTIRNAIKADLVEKGKEIWEIGNELRQELRQGKGAHAYLLEKYHMSMLNAQRAFNRFGGYRQGSTWNKVYRMLDNAQLDMLRIEMEATRIFDPVLKTKADFEKAQNLTSLKKGALVDVGLRDENGRSVWITRGMMLSLYMHLQNEQNMKHLMYGGLTLPDFKRYYDGNPEAWGRGTVEIPALGARVSNLEQLLEEQGEEWVRSQYKTMEEDIKKMFESVRESIEKQMTDYDRKWIEASKDFFDNFSRRELNRVTNSMYGFSKAKVDNYFPIVTDSNFLKSEFDSISRNVSLENAGFMKERVKASNPILLEDITRTVNRQISNVSRYAGLTEALKQFGNIYNVQTKGFTDSVKKAMAKSYGKTGQEYIQNLITDMVGGRSTPGTIFDRIKGNYAQAVLSANLSVTIKQAASYPTAAATVGWKPLMKALAKGGRNNRVFSRADRALIDTYSPLLWKRSQGAIDTEIGDMAHAQDWTKKAKWLMGWIEKTDIATVGRLWYAAEYYVKDNFKGLEKGTAEQIQNGESPFYQKVSEIFNRIVEETQPNYTVLQRPDILRNPNKLLRSLVMFSTQRFQNGQILMDAAAEYGAMRSLDRKGSTEETKAARREAKRKLTWAITSQAVSAVVLNAMTLLAGAVMHRMNPWRDDDDEITLESTAGALLDGWVESLAGSFLGGSEIYEALDSLLTGSTYYGNDVGGLSSINDFASAIITMGQKAVKLVGDENSKPEDWAKLAKTQLWKVGEYLSQMTGVPAANIRKILEGASLHIQDAMETHLFSYEAGLARSNATNARRYAEAWEAGDMEKMQAVIAEMNRNLEKAGKSTDGARDAITKAAKERYEAGEIELAQYADFLRQAGYLEEDKIESKIRDFLRDELVTGDRTEDEVLRLLTELGGLTEDKAWKKVMEWKAKAETGDSEEEDEAAKYSEYDALRDALRSGQKLKDAAKDYLAHGYTEKQVLDAATKDLKARFQAGEVSEDKAIDLLVEYSGKDEDACWKTVQGWIGAMEHPEDEDYSWGQYDAIDEALAGNKEVKGLISELTAHGVKEDSINQHIKGQLVQNYVDGKTNESQLKNQLSRYLGIVAKADVDKILKDANSKKLYGVAYSSLDEEYRAGKIGKAEIKQALMKQGGLSSGEAEQKIRWYDLQKANPKLDISETVCNAWYDGTTGYSQKYGHESAKDAGMSIERYVEARKYLDTVKDANGNNTGEDEVIQALAGMSGLTAREKDALYYERYKGGTRKGIYKTW